MLEDVLVRVGEYYVSVDFVIMDINEDWQILIILGRPFLATVGAIIGVKWGKLTFKVGEDNIEIILDFFLKNPYLRDYCCLIELLTGCVQESATKPSSTNKLEEYLLGSTKVEKDDTKAKVYGKVLDESPVPTSQGFEAPIVKGNDFAYPQRWSMSSSIWSAPPEMSSPVGFALHFEMLCRVSVCDSRTCLC